ncbi:hypothetical protein Bca4012_062179 [Brassica carinata]
MSRKVDSLCVWTCSSLTISNLRLSKEPSVPTMTRKSSVSTMTRLFAMTHGEFSQQEKATIGAIVNESSYALSIVLVSRDGPWADMRKFNDFQEPKREKDPTTIVCLCFFF